MSSVAACTAGPSSLLDRAQGQGEKAWLPGGNALERGSGGQAAVMAAMICCPSQAPGHCTGAVEPGVPTPCALRTEQAGSSHMQRLSWHVLACALGAARFDRHGRAGLAADYCWGPDGLATGRCSFSRQLGSECTRRDEFPGAPACSLDLVRAALCDTPASCGCSAP